jgi:hypothetical protein
MYSSLVFIKIYHLPPQVWALGEVIRYPIYLLPLLGVPVPRALTYLRYTAPFLLMPVGFAAEIFLIYAAANQESGTLATGLRVYLLAYVVAPVYLLRALWQQRGAKLATASGTDEDAGKKNQ